MLLLFLTYATLTLLISSVTELAKIL